MKTVRVEISSPGGSGEMRMTITEAEYDFLYRFALRWNDENPLHAQPYLFYQVESETNETT